MVLGRLAHYGFDLLAVSTIVAGIKKTTGFACVYIPEAPQLRPFHLQATVLLCISPQTALISDDTARSVADSYLGIGETIFASVSGIAVNSQYWGRDPNPKR